MEYIDMHMHTACGHPDYGSLEQLLSMAKQNGVKVISFTDHNTLKAYFELRKKYSSNEIEKIYGVRIVVGTEINCKIGEQFNDMLVYNISNLDEFQSWLDNNTDLDKTIQAQVEQLDYYKSIAKSLGLKFDEDDIELTREDPWAGRAMAKALYKYSDENCKFIPMDDLKYPTMFFMHHCSNPKSQFFFDISKYRPRIEDLLSIAHKCGGLVFMAHPGAYTGNDPQKLQKYLELGKSLGIDGVEIDNSFNQDISIYRTIPAQFCIGNHLRMSAGTDIHTLLDHDYTRNKLRSHT